jgi:hypothetical protein
LCAGLITSAKGENLREKRRRYNGALSKRVKLTLGV